jgi:hypothetical protein
MDLTLNEPGANTLVLPLNIMEAMSIDAMRVSTKDIAHTGGTLFNGMLAPCAPLTHLHKL